MKKKYSTQKKSKTGGAYSIAEGKHIKEDAKQKTSNEVVERNLKKKIILGQYHKGS